MYIPYPSKHTDTNLYSVHTAVQHVFEEYLLSCIGNLTAPRIPTLHLKTPSAEDIDCKKIHSSGPYSYLKLTNCYRKERGRKYTR